MNFYKQNNKLENRRDISKYKDINEHITSKKYYFFVSKNKGLQI